MVLFAVLLFAAFAALTGAVHLGAVAGFDTAIHEWFLGFRDESLTTGAVVITHAGGTVAMWMLALVACGGLLWRGRRADAALVAGVGAVAAVAVPVFKDLIGRVRPPLDDRLVTIDSPAFPSGHSAGAAAVIGVLSVLCWLRFRHRVAVRITVLLAAVFVGLVGLSRVYLGVHWATDVLAGWSLGGLLVLLGVLMHRRAGRSARPDTVAAELTVSRPGAEAASATGIAG
ncbi:phosphatase PAP2 family protein [Nocardia speluncae]|uniref:Phosphatase PAP2 family protein n=1 Tax=Nocardia speluncae TaxID=419477 RepID=A0A846XAY0_9NOCA|nr:phosphatase PAP2 family protein [Nocardia speluncae]NKY31806.1 phosphatase PAP2 family protein [Nocardia speluncae]